MKNLSLINSITAIALAVITFSTITCESDITLASEPWGKAYGFPLLWHTHSVTSLSRQIAIYAFSIDLAIYLTASFFLVILLFNKSLLNNFKRIKLSISILAILLAIYCSYMTAINFLDPVVSNFLNDFQVVNGTYKISIGFQTQ